MAKQHDLKLVISNSNGSGSKEYDEESIVTLSTDRLIFEGAPSIGKCITGELECEVRISSSEIPRNAEIKPFVKRVDETTWHQKSAFYIFQRKIDVQTGLLRIVAYDNTYRMEGLMIEGSTDLQNWPKSAEAVMTEIVQRCNITINPSDLQYIHDHPKYVRFPGARVVSQEENDESGGDEYVAADGEGMTMREVAGNVAAMYGANWAMNDDGFLQLFAIGDVSPESDYLVNEGRDIITYGTESGEVAILVR